MLREVQFGDRYMQAIVMESSLLAAIEAQSDQTAAAADS